MSSVPPACERSRKTKFTPKGMPPYSSVLSSRTNYSSYVELLERQQAQLVAGLRELYNRLQDDKGWPGSPLPKVQDGHPLTHDILEKLGLLHSSSDNAGNYEGFEEDCNHSSSDNAGNYEGFEEDCNRMQQRLLENGAGCSHGSSSASYGTPTTKPFDPFAPNYALLTPLMDNPFPGQPQLTSTAQPNTTFMQTDLERATMDFQYVNQPLNQFLFPPGW